MIEADGGSNIPEAGAPPIAVEGFPCPFQRASSGPRGSPAALFADPLDRSTRPPRHFWPRHGAKTSSTG